MKEPIWKGPPAKCRYCRDGIFPHGHDDPGDDSVEGAEPKPKPPKSTKKSSGTPRKPAGRRGRPMKPENALLLKVCKGH